MRKYDVVIIGGGTAGCSCAWNCSRLGLKTLLIEKSSVLGGAMTSGLVIPVMETGKNLINTDFYKFLIKKMREFGGQITYQENPGWFNPELLKIVLDDILLDTGVDIIFNTDVCNVKILNSKVCHVEIKKKILSSYTYEIDTDNLFVENDNMLSECIEAKFFVDATGDGIFCQKIGCEILENSGEFQPMSLRFIMSGIDLNKFGEFILKIDSNREVTTVENIDGQIHLSTACTWDSDKQWALTPLFKNGIEKRYLKPSDSNYFQVFSIAGMPNSLAFNCPRIPENLNPNSIEDRTKALVEGRAAINRISNFCKKCFPGFESAFISNISDSLGVRVSNRIRGKYVYTIDDLKSGKKFTHPALISNYPVDVHSANKDSSTLDKTGEYQLPIESLMSSNFDNVFMVGRCISADYLSQGALRVQANCFSMGEAVAKYINGL